MPFVVVLAVMFGSRLGPHDRLVPAFLLVWGPPVAVYLLVLRTRAGSVLTGLGLVGLLWVLSERYSVALDSSADWFVGNTAAVQTEIATVLGSLTRLRIRGEYISGPDTGGLDNVSLTVVPLPASGLLMGAALLVPLWRGRRSG